MSTGNETVGESGGVARRADEDTRALPDPLILAGALLPPTVLERRLRFLRAMGWYPLDERPLLLQLSSSAPIDPGTLAAIDHVRTNAGGPPLVLDVEMDQGEQMAALLTRLRPPVYRLAPERSAEDLLAAIRGSRCWVGSSSVGAALAVAQDVPFLHLGPSPARTLVQLLPRLLGRGGRESAAALREELAQRLTDELVVLAALAQREWQRRASSATATTLAARLAAAQQHQLRLRRAWQGARDNVLALRLALAEARSPPLSAGDLALRVGELETALSLAVTGASRAEHERDLAIGRLEGEQAERRDAQHKAAMARREAAEMRAQLEAFERLLGTRALRFAAAVQRLLARLRHP